MIQAIFLHLSEFYMEKAEAVFVFCQIIIMFINFYESKRMILWMGFYDIDTLG